MPLDGGVRCQRASVRGREMKVKTIPIMLLLLISVATPVVVSMAVPKSAEDFYVEAVLGEVFLEIRKGVQKYTQGGVLFDAENNEVGTIVFHVVITNFDKATTGKYARARVHFVMQFYDSRTISGTLVGKLWFDENWVQHVDGIFVGRGSHVKGTVYMIEQPNVVVFDGIEW